MKRVLLFLSYFISLTVFASVGIANAAAESQPAAETNSEPAAVVEKVTKDLLDLVKTKAGLLKTNPDQYFADVRGLLVGVVDFEFIAKNVMGRSHWSAVSPEEQQRFVNVFTDSLVRTYGKGMANFADLDVEVASSKQNDKSPDIYYVVQSVKTEKGKSEIVYTMRKEAKGWMLKNVVLDGVNLGKTFQSQFNQAVKDNGGNVSKAIANWSAEDAKKAST